MGCCDSDSVQVSKMALELKSGPMLWYKRRFFGSNWRDVHSVLYNDSSILWYKDKSRQEQEGGVVLKEAPELIAFGVYTSQVPDRPSLPDNYEPKELLAFGVRGKDVVYWFLCPNEEEVASWMAAIASSLPPPPMPPQFPQPSAMPSEIPPSSAPPPMGLPNQHMPVPQYTPQQPPPQYTPSQHQQMPSYAPRPPAGIPGQYPAPTSYRPPPYQTSNVVHPQPYQAPSGGGPTTVIVQDRPGYTGGGGGGDFAMGMLLGGAIGTAWGSHSHYGYGGGWGLGGGWGGHGPSHNDTNVHINNYYDNDTTTVNNNLDMTNNMSIEQATPEQATVAPQEYEPVQDAVEYLPVEETTEYIPVEDAGGAMYGGGGECYDGDFGGDFGGGDFGDFGGGDFGDF